MKKILQPGIVQIRPQPDVTRVERQRALRDLHQNDPACPLSAYHSQEIDRDRPPGPSSLPAYQILATCKQAYQEGFARFYTKNTFFLPPGSVEHAIIYFNGLAPQTRAMIKKIGIRFTVEDLVPTEILQKEIVLGCDDEWTTAWKSEEPKEDPSYLCAVKLREIWFQKLLWVRKWDTVRVAKLEFWPLGKDTCFRTEHLNFDLEKVDINRFKARRWPNLYQTWFKEGGPILAVASEAADAAYEIIQEKINKEGWVKCREWIITEQKKRLSLSD